MSNQTSEQTSSSKKKNILILIIGLGCLIPFLFLALLVAIGLPSFLSGANKAKQAEAKYYIGAMNRSQQVHFLKKNKFASSISELQIVLKPETINYLYNVNVINPKQSVKSTAKAKISGIKSYTGAVFSQKIGADNLTIAAACETNQPSQIPPDMPKFIGKAIQCPPGSTLITK